MSNLRAQTAGPRRRGRGGDRPAGRGERNCVGVTSAGKAPKERAAAATGAAPEEGGRCAAGCSWGRAFGPHQKGRRGGTFQGRSAGAPAREDLASPRPAAGGPRLRAPVPARLGPQLLLRAPLDHGWQLSALGPKVRPFPPLCPTQCPANSVFALGRSNLPCGGAWVCADRALCTPDSCGPGLGEERVGEGGGPGRLPGAPGWVRPWSGSGTDGVQPPGGPGLGSMVPQKAGAGLCADAAWRGFAPCRGAGFRGPDGNRRKQDEGKPPPIPSTLIWVSAVAGRD